MAGDALEMAISIGEASNGLNNTTMGWALTFFHEYFHTDAGGALVDPSNAGDPQPGETVQKVNEIRAELGSEYGQRKNYYGSIIDFGEGRYVSRSNPKVYPEKTKGNLRKYSRGEYIAPKYKYKRKS